MKNACKSYKKEVKSAHNTHRNQIRKEVRNLRNHGNIKTYWEYIKKKKRSSKNNENIDFQSFVDFFKNINTTEINDQNIQYPQMVHEVNEELDRLITEEDIIAGAKKLKSGKAVGGDDISNEQIKASIHILKTILAKIFNIVFNEGIIPTAWTEGIIKPIYKNKGERNNPDNYRPITILSCMGKLFTTILNSRLTQYIQSQELLGEEQLGFRQNYSTIDGVYIVNALLEMLSNNNKSLYCAFIDLKKCFGSIWRYGMFFKLYTYKIGSKMMNVLKCMYEKLKSCLQMNYVDTHGKMSYNISEIFPCVNGLREGDILSPLLFSLYVNDLKSFLEQTHCHGIEVQYTNENDVMCYLQMLLLMYADDTVLFATSKRQLQHSLNMYERYCRQWKLQVNVDKTKILIFGRKRRQTFTLNNKQVEVIDKFKYLGVIFNRNGKFLDAIKDNINKARLAMYTLRRTFKEKHIPIDCQIEIFEKTIEPILLYGAEIWGFENRSTQLIEKYYLKTLKQILGLRKSTPTYMIYGETGKYPLGVKIKMRMLNFTVKLVRGEGKKISEILLKSMLNDRTNEYKWLSGIKRILTETGFPYLTQQIPNIQHHNNMIQQILIDQSLQNLNTDSSKCTYYKYLKNERGMAHYLKCLSDKHTIALLRFRTANHHLPIEVGRYNNTPRHNRLCPFCQGLADEFHFLFLCPRFEAQRHIYIRTQYTIRPNMYKYHKLINTEDIQQLQKLATFTSIIMKTFQ